MTNPMTHERVAMEVIVANHYQIPLHLADEVFLMPDNDMHNWAINKLYITGNPALHHAAPELALLLALEDILAKPLPTELGELKHDKYFRRIKIRRSKI